jgi:hypothetical protein
MSAEWSTPPRVGAKPDLNYLAIRATSKKKWRSYQPSDDADYYYIPGGKLEWFDLDTWMLFSDPQDQRGNVPQA